MGYLPDNETDLDKTREGCEMWLKDPENIK